jgi:hypothetical protein
VEEAYLGLPELTEIAECSPAWPVAIITEEVNSVRGVLSLPSTWLSSPPMSWSSVAGDKALVHSANFFEGFNLVGRIDPLLAGDCPSFFSG